MLLTEYDNNKNAVINPDLVHKPIPNFPKTAVSIFSKTLIDEIVTTLKPEIITIITNATNIKRLFFFIFRPSFFFILYIIRSFLSNMYFTE